MAQINNPYSKDYNIDDSSTITGRIQKSNSSNNSIGKYVNDIFGIGKNGYGVYNSLGSGSSGFSGAGAFSLIPGAFNALKTGLSGGSWGEDVPQSFFGIDDENDSDVMQGIKGATNGAMMGTAIFPGVGTVIGGLLGLGASFLDDI